MLLVEKTFRIKKERKKERKKKETKRFKNRKILEKTTTCKYISSPSRKID